MFTLSNMYVAWRQSGIKHSGELSEILRAIVERRSVSAVARVKALGGNAEISSEECDSVVHLTDTAYMTLQSRLRVNLSTYTFYSTSSEPPSSDLYVLFKTNSVESATSGDSVSLRELCKPLAYRAGSPLHTVCQCTVDEYVNIIDAFFKGRLLSIPQLVSIESVAIVDITDTAETNSRFAQFAIIKSSHFLADSKVASNVHQYLCVLDQSVKSQSDDKPPSRTARRDAAVNILIYVGEGEGSDSLYSSTHKMLSEGQVDTEWYIIYRLSKHDALQANWVKCCALLIIADNHVAEESDEIYKRFTDYFNNGGHILTIGSSYDENICTLERFPATDSEDGFQRIDVKYDEGRQLASDILAKHYYKDNICKMDGVTMTTLAVTTSSQTVILEASKESSGRAILSQVLLNQNIQNVVSLYGYVLDSLSVRKASNKNENLATVCHIYSPQERIGEAFVKHISGSSLGSVENDILTIPKVAEFDLKRPETVTTFNWKAYGESLTSRVLGNVLLYQEMCASTQLIVQPFNSVFDAKFGVVAIAHRQFSGIGRGSNSWISPAGSLSLSMQISFPMASNLGQTPAILQTIPAVAIARIFSALLPQSSKSPDCKVSVKWPNDIYYKKTKIGGVIASCTMLRDQFIAILGVGVNVKNLKPTENVNDIIHDYNELNGTSIPNMSVECLAGRLCTDIEYLIDLINEDKSEYYNEYYKHWMHSGVKVRVPNHNDKESLVVGLDEHGYLRLQMDDGSTFSVQPDGNSFDILHNLITVKEKRV